MRNDPGAALDRLRTRLKLPESTLNDLADLQFMASYKYNHYDMYLPGTRFMDQLALWLAQFAVEDRPIAITLIRRKLIFISQREMQELAHFLYYNQIVPATLALAISQEGLPPYAYVEAFERYFHHYLRASLFIGLSDGARIDYFRRHHIDLSQDQVIPYYRSSPDDYLLKLREALADESAQFRQVFLIDDFTASGYTLAHTTHQGRVEGSLSRLYEVHRHLIDAADRVYVAYYVASRQAIDHVSGLLDHMPGYAGKSQFMAALPLEQQTTIWSNDQDDGDLGRKARELCDKYYSTDLESSNTLKGGGVRYGFGRSGLVLSMHSNTPNNSIFLLWRSSKGSRSDSGGTTALFRRIDRHRLG